MRLRNIKDAKKRIEESNYIIQHPEQFKGNYYKIFHNNNDINIEIGMGKGDFIIEMAKLYPEINFIGIEKFDSVLLRAVQKLEQQQISNLKLIRFDATEINNIFSKEIDTIYLNFSDPWPKPRHKHRRLTNERFLNKYSDIFKSNPHIIMKTDNRKLFEYSLISLVQNGYLIQNISLDLYKDEDKNNVPTEYEKKFHQLGQVIYKTDVYKTLHVK